MQVNKAHILTKHKDCIYGLQAGKEDTDLFSADASGVVLYWNLSEPNRNQVIATFPHSVYALNYLKDRDQLVVGHNYEGIHVLDCANKKEAASLKLTSKAIFEIRCYGKYLFIACGDGDIVIIEMKTWSIVKRLCYSSQSARVMAINPLTEELAVGYSDCKIRIFDLQHFKLKREWNAHTYSVFSMSYTPDMKYLYSGSRDAHLKIWDATGSYQLVQDIIAHIYAINHMVFSPDGKYFVTCSMDRSIKIWSTNERKLLKVIDKARYASHSNSVNKLSWASYRGGLVSGSDDRTLLVWDLSFESNAGDRP